MKYKIVKGSKSFELLNEVVKRIKVIQKQCTEICIEFGGTGEWCRASFGVTGNIIAIEFPKGISKPEGWKQLGEKYQNLFFPKSIKENVSILERFRSIEVIDQSEINAIIGFNGPQCIMDGQSLCMVSLPIISFAKYCFLMDVPDKCTFTPNSDTWEILGSEYIHLQNFIEKEVNNG